MASKQDSPAGDTRPDGTEQAPAGSSAPATAPVNTSGLPEPSAPADHSAEAEADKHGSHKGHVEMAKDGVKIHVNPETVAAHEAAGWHRH